MHNTISKGIDGIKTPKVTIPPFSDNYIDQLYFKNLYKAISHDNVNLSKVQI